MSELPIFDISNIENDEGLQKDIIEAERYYGAYMFKGYDPKIEGYLQETRRVATEFMARSTEEKMKFDYALYDHDNGYFPKGGEKSAHNEFADTLEYWMSGPKTATSPALEKIFTPRPQVDDDFDTATGKMYDAFKEIDRRLSIPLSNYIFNDPYYLAEQSQHGFHKLRVTFGAKKGDRIAPHRDRCRQTILFPRQPGLVIEARNGTQVPGHVPEGVGLKNNGYQLGWLTNDDILPCNHWAEAQSDGRMSIVFFGHMNPDFVLQPQEQFENQKPIEGYPDTPMTVAEYADFRKAYNDPDNIELTEDYIAAPGDRTEAA